jgi:hypothetical protein
MQREKKARIRAASQQHVVTESCKVLCCVLVDQTRPLIAHPGVTTIVDRSRQCKKQMPTVSYHATQQLHHITAEHTAECLRLRVFLACFNDVPYHDQIEVNSSLLLALDWLGSGDWSSFS